MDDASQNDVTQLLVRWTQGDRGALDALTSAVYAELRRIAESYLMRERTDHTLQPTALVHEAWLRLVKASPDSFKTRKQFFGLAAHVMRRILVDHARGRNAEKRGAGSPKTTVSSIVANPSLDAEELVVLDDALSRLSLWSPRKAQVIEMRYFGGLNVEEIAELLDTSIATVSREQRMAEAWLVHAMSEGSQLQNES